MVYEKRYFFVEILTDEDVSNVSDLVQCHFKTEVEQKSVCGYVPYATKHLFMSLKSY